MVPPVVQRRVRGAARARGRGPRCPVSADRPLDMRGDRGNAMCRPVQQAAERVLVCHLHLPLSISDRETLALIECRGRLELALDRQRIVAEAVALDAEGLDGVTTRKLAARLVCNRRPCTGICPTRRRWSPRLPTRSSTRVRRHVTARVGSTLAGLVERPGRAAAPSAARPSGRRAGHLGLPALRHNGSDLRTGHEYLAGAASRYDRPA